MKKTQCALIMAGGRGTRFWPKSTEKKPKQFLNLIGDKTMIQLTIDRITKLIPIENVFVCTSSEYKNLVREQLPTLNERNIIIEPLGMNTAPCILLSAMYINQIYNDANLVVLPSDHIINNDEKFIDVLLEGMKFIEENIGIVTIGIVPNRPETGYGYIKVKKIEKNLIPVEKFVEKPDIDHALEYLKTQKYLWNAGMFLFNTNYIINEYKYLVPEMYNILKKVPNIKDCNYFDVLNKIYPLCEKISFDYAIMEKTRHAYVIPSELGWDDIGTWNSIERYLEKDENKNIIKGNIILEQCNNCIVYGNDKKIILLNVNDIFCIDSDDLIVIGNREKINEIINYRNK